MVCVCVYVCCVYVYGACLCVVWEDMNRSYRLLHCNNKFGNPYVLSTILGTVSRVTVSSATLATTYSPTRTDYNGYQGYAVASGHILQKTTEGIALCRRCMTASNPWTCITMPLHVHMGRVGGQICAGHVMCSCAKLQWSHEHHVTSAINFALST